MALSRVKIVRNDSKITGDRSGIIGDMSGIWGDMSGIWGDVTGYGIGPTVCDNEHPILTVNTVDQQVEWSERSGDTPGDAIKIPFAKFVS